MGYDSRKWDIVKSLVWDIFPGNGMRLPEMGFKKSLIWDVIFIEINVKNRPFRVVVMDIFVCVARTENPTLFFYGQKCPLKLSNYYFLWTLQWGLRTKMSIKKM